MILWKNVLKHLAKMEIESGILLLKAELSEQTQIINACKQDICKLTNENLTSKSRLSELEEKVFVNKSIPCCKGNAQTAASNDDNLQSATLTVSDSSTVTIRQSSNNPTLSTGRTIKMILIYNRKSPELINGKT